MKNLKILILFFSISVFENLESVSENLNLPDPKVHDERIEKVKTDTLYNLNITQCIINAKWPERKLCVYNDKTGKYEFVDKEESIKSNKFYIEKYNGEEEFFIDFENFSAPSILVFLSNPENSNFKKQLEKIYLKKCNKKEWLVYKIFGAPDYYKNNITNFK